MFSTTRHFSTEIYTLTLIQEKKQLPFFNIEKFCMCYFVGNPAPFNTVHARLNAFYKDNFPLSKHKILDFRLLT